MWAWLNPRNLLQVISIAKRLIAGATLLYNYLKGVIIKKKQEKDVKKTEDAVHHIEEANKIEDDKARLEEKKKAACELEKSFNPDSKC